MAQLTIQQTFDLALQHHRTGRLKEAEKLYRQILARQPGHSDAMQCLGALVSQLGRHEMAVDLIRGAIAINPKSATTFCNLGNALMGLKQPEVAITAYRQASVLDPNLAEAHGNLGNALIDIERMDEAIEAFRRAIDLRPNYAEAHSNLGRALRRRGKFDEAIAAFRRAIELRPTFAEAYSNLGNALQDVDRFDEAIAAYRQAIALDPKLAEAHNNLGSALLRNGQPDDAIAAFHQAIALRSNYADALGNLGTALRATGQLDEAIAANRKALALMPESAQAHSNLVFSLQYHPDFDAPAIAQELRCWNERHGEPLKRFIRPRSTGSGHAQINDRSPDRRLRVGYVSPNLNANPVGWFLLPLLANHDHQQVEVFAYEAVCRADAITERLRGYSDTWRSLVGLSDADAANQIRDDRIDILVDLGLHGPNNRLLVFARKPAPVQVTYLAYAGSSGLTAMDYRLSDPHLDPAGIDESIYSERTFRLPETYWCYGPVSDVPPKPPPALGNGFVTFGCLNEFAKINDRLLGLWARLLGQIPRSRLLLHAFEGLHRRRVLDFLHREGIDSQRVDFVGRLPPAKYLEQYHRIDIALDTSPYAGGTTTCDAIWMGVPVVSLAGKTAVGRGGLSILTNVGLPDLVAHTPEDYTRIAAELANDLPHIQELHSTLRQRMQKSPLMDAPAFARNIELAYQQMWQNWCKTASLSSQSR